MDYADLVKQLTPELHRAFKRALELGRWPDGKQVTAAQREHCMHAVIAYDEHSLPPQQRVGFIDRGNKQGEQCDEVPPTAEPMPLKWK